MKRLPRIAWQSLLLMVAGAAIGFGVNAVSNQPLPLVRQAPPPVEELWEILSADEVLAKIEAGEAIVLDARDPAEFEAGHILGAANLPEARFMEYFPEVADPLPRNFPIIVYCQGGLCDQSHEVLSQLEEFGFEELYLYKQGWEEWSRLDYPTEKGE